MVKLLQFDGRPNAEFPAWKRSDYFVQPLLARPIDDDLSGTNDPSGLKKAIYLLALGRLSKICTARSNTCTRINLA